jgi:DNA-3-methyladenine glycosylase
MPSRITQRPQSAGLLLFRRNNRALEVLLGHPGGPFWSRKDDGAWSIPKGLVMENEEILAAALREFEEETGFSPPGKPLSLGEFRRAGGKLVHVWAMECDWDPGRLTSNTFLMEWPPKSGRQQEFPELDRAAWFPLEEARLKILKGQAVFLERLQEAIAGSQPPASHSVLPPSFFQRPAAKVARDLLGKSLVRKHRGKIVKAAICETEAYEGTHDRASHSFRGRTPRTEVMFGPAGRFYVYRIYGLHWMLNVVTGDVDEAAAVLIRGIEGVSGPARVAAALHIDASLNGRDAAPSSGLWFEDSDHPQKRLRVQRLPRVGVDYAGPLWAAKKLRFLLR